MFHKHRLYIIRYKKCIFTSTFFSTEHLLFADMCKLKAIPISSCYCCRRQLSTKSFRDELPNSLVEEDEDEELVAAVRKSVEERRRRKAMYTPYDYSWTFPPAIEKLFVASETLSQPQNELRFAQNEGAGEDGEDDDEFYSATSSLSDGTIAIVMKSFSVCHWLECDGNKDVAERWKKQLLLLEEVVGCEGWPFGLLRKVILLPPLPSSPSDSWSWTKAQKMKHCLQQKSEHLEARPMK